MTPDAENPEQLDALLATPDLADALASDRFKQFLDHIPVAILVSQVDGADERIVYANHGAAEATGTSIEVLCRQPWAALDAQWSGNDGVGLGAAIAQGRQPVGAFAGGLGDGQAGRTLEAFSALIEDDGGAARFRLVALVDISKSDLDNRLSLEGRLRDKDLLLQEIQHRVKNNLQMITALIRMEARRTVAHPEGAPFDRLAGRIEALGLLYQQLSSETAAAVEEVDLGSFLSQIAGAVMKANATEGVRLNLQVDVMAAKIDVAMPLGLLVNELMTNALKYAFVGRDEGAVSLRCVKDADDLCTVSIGDDGVGMAADAKWPLPGKLGALIVRSLEDNTRAKIEQTSRSGEGVTTQIRFQLPRPPEASPT